MNLYDPDRTSERWHLLRKVFLLFLLVVALALGLVFLARQRSSFPLLLFNLLADASLGLLISAISRKEDQVIVLCLIVMFVFSAMGGAWFPLEVTGKAFNAIGHLLPSAWAMDGFQNIIVRGLGFDSVLLPAGLLLAYTLAFFGLAIWRFKFE